MRVPMTPAGFAETMARTPGLGQRHSIIGADLDAEQAAIRTGLDAELARIRSRPTTQDAQGGTVIALGAPTTPADHEEAA